ncbi:MAG TPA: hypothetical protein VF013_04975 [Candidatus Limnocylindria bacterium]
MSHLARWYVLLGIVAFAGAAVLLGATTGELLRRSEAGWETLLRYEAPIILLVIIGVFLFTTAAGLAAARPSALGLAMSEAIGLVILGLVLLTSGSRVATALQAPQVFVVMGLPVALGAILIGARLIRSLWRSAAERTPFSRADVRTIVILGGVVAAGIAAHLVASGTLRSA